MGASSIAALAALGTSILLVTQIFNSGFIPEISEITHAYKNMADRAVEQHQTNVNIKNVYDAGWYDTDWNFRKMVLIDHNKVVSDLENFPVLIYLKNDSDLAGDALSSGNDIMFVSSDNNTQYSHEIESFNSTTGELTAWVNMSHLYSEKDTVLYMYYGNPASDNQENIEGTWNENFHFVQHLNETNGTLYDSTYNDNDGTNNGSAFNTSAKINGGYDFNNSDYLIFSDDDSLDFTNSITLEAWVKDPPFIKSNKKSSNIRIADKRDEKKLVLNKNKFTTERTIYSDTKTELIFVALCTPGVLLNEMLIDEESIISSSYIKNKPNNKQEFEIEELLNDMNINIDEFEKLFYSEPFSIGNKLDIQMNFEAEKDKQLTDGKISYLAISADNCYDFEKTTSLRFVKTAIDLLKWLGLIEKKDIISDQLEDIFIETRVLEGIANQPIKWIKEIRFENTQKEIKRFSEKISLPSYAKDIKIVNEDGIDIRNNFSISDYGSSKNIEFIEDINLNEKKSFYIYYSTPEPKLVEKKINRFRQQVTISSDIHYENITAFSSIDDRSAGTIHLYHLVGDERIKVGFNPIDIDGDTLIDRIEWNVPHLLEQKYEIVIEIVRAEHLDEKRNFISDIFNEVIKKDNIWSEPIRNNEYVRATFAEALDSSSDITIFARSNGESQIEVYTRDSNTLITRFDEITSESWYRVYLASLTGKHTTFDLKTIGDPIEYDYIIDPTPQTSVDTISPYNQSSSPLTITALNTTDADNVTLYFRYSSDNASWVSQSSWSTEFDETWSSGSDNDYEGDDDPDPEGDFSDMWWNINDDNGDLTDIQVGNYGNPGEETNCIYFRDNDNNQYGEARDVGGAYWNASGSQWTEGYINFTYDYYVDNNEGVNFDVWRGVGWTTVWSDINTAGNNQEAADPGWATHSYQLVAADLAAEQFSFRFELVGPGNQDRLFIDDITLEVKTTNYNWVDYSTDFAYPWSWSFNFPNGTGYYQFYSQGKAAGESDEAEPYNIADAICYYNIPPTPTGEGPADGSTAIEKKPLLNLTVDDADDDTLTAYWYSNSSGSWSLFDTNNSIDTSTGAVVIQQTNDNFNEWGTSYWWSVNVTDGIGSINETYRFTTSHIPDLNNSGPAELSTDLNLTPICNITVSDQDGGTVDVSFYENTSGPWVLQQTNISVDVSTPSNVVWNNYNNASDWAETYYWMVNVTDSQGASRQIIYQFTTSYPPELSNPDPGNESTSVPPQPICTITVSDTDGGTVDVCFYENTTGSWVLQQTNSSVDVSTPANVVWNNYNNASATTTNYYWKVNVTDAKGLDDEETYLFTTSAGNPPIQSNEYPADTQTNISISITTINVTIEDPDADLINWTIQTKPNIGSNSSTNEGNGSKECSVSGLSYATTYTWYVNATDGVDWSNETYTFTTSYLPQLSNPGPSNGSTNIELKTVCNVTVSDTDGGTVDVCFYENTTGSWKLQQTNSGVDVSTPANVIWNKYNNASVRFTDYWWKVNVTDQDGNYIEEIYHFRTTKGNATTIELINPSPNGTTGVQTQPSCRVRLNDTDGDTLTVYWYENTSGPYTLKAKYNNNVTANTTTGYQFEAFDNYSTNYYWKVVVNDSFFNSSAVFYFSTQPINTYVESLDYVQPVTPININVTGPCDLDNVTLYYRWSGDNSSWGTWSTIFSETFPFSDMGWEGSDDGDTAQDEYWIVDQEGGDTAAITVRNVNNPPSAPNCLNWNEYDPNNFNGGHAEGRGAGNTTWNPLNETWTAGFINYTWDYYVDTNEGIQFSTWNGSSWDVQWQRLAVGDNEQPGWTTNSWQIPSWALNLTEFSFRITPDAPGGQDHVYLDNVAIQVKKGVDWTEFDNVSNPDSICPWNWTFDFPHGKGHYEFYSIGQKEGSTIEPTPVSADSYVNYTANLAIFPELSNETPSNQSVGIDLYPILGVQINHSEGDKMNITWYWGTNESCPNFIGSNNTVGNGTYYMNNSVNFSDKSTTYFWKVSVNDSDGEITNATYHFKTYGENKEFVSKGRDAYALEVSQDGTTLFGFVNNTNVTYPIDTNWHYVVLTYSGANINLYMDGILVNSTSMTGNMSINAKNLILGEKLTGSLDEVRISNIKRSAAWIGTSYNMMNSPTQFIQVESEQNQNYTYINVSFENDGSVNLNVEGCSILVNGTLMSFVDLQPELYSEKITDVYINVSASGSKRIKFITANGISDCEVYV